MLLYATGLARRDGISAMLRIEIEREEDGRWIGEVPELPGVLAYGSTEVEARIKTTALALRMIAGGRNKLKEGRRRERDEFVRRIRFPR
jgi:predicted RNase H-like HicB family nuclease